mgnify:CR=1 FL=1
MNDALCKPSFQARIIVSIFVDFNNIFIIVLYLEFLPHDPFERKEVDDLPLAIHRGSATFGKFMIRTMHAMLIGRVIRKLFGGSKGFRVSAYLSKSMFLCKV